jgi:hypothetical protein
MRCHVEVMYVGRVLGFICDFLVRIIFMVITKMFIEKSIKVAVSGPGWVRRNVSLLSHPPTHTLTLKIFHRLDQKLLSSLMTELREPNGTDRLFNHKPHYR